MAAPKRGARRAGRSIVFIDETGFMLQPVVRRTWAPRGQTPIHYSWDRHDRLSGISALTVSPERRRLGLYFELYDQNVTNLEVADFLHNLRRLLGRDLLVIWDRLNAHRTAARRLQEQKGSAFRFEWLPPYAPDLNPVEPVWAHTKHGDLANFLPENVDHLWLGAVASLESTRLKPRLLRSFFKHAQLSL